MKPLVVTENLNYEFPVSCVNALTGQDCSAAGFYPADLCRDFYSWRSNTLDQIDIYFEISEEDSLTTFAVLGSTLSTKSQVYISASNTSGVGGFYSPIYTKSLVQKNKNWMYHSNDPLPSARYYKLSIIENSEVEIDYVEISRIICGKAKALPVPLADGFTNGKESYQKRDIQKGQWRPGSENSMLNRFELEFAPLFGNRAVKNSDHLLYYEMNAFIEDVKTSKPFLLILNPKSPYQMFDYFTLDGDSIDINYEDNGGVIYMLSCKELK